MTRQGCEPEVTDLRHNIFSDRRWAAGNQLDSDLTGRIAEIVAKNDTSKGTRAQIFNFAIPRMPIQGAFAGVTHGGKKWSHFSPAN